jgi:hypothetical protein
MMNLTVKEIKAAIKEDKRHMNGGWGISVVSKYHCLGKDSRHKETQRPLLCSSWRQSFVDAINENVMPVTCLCEWEWSAAQLLVPSWVLLWCIKDCAPGDCLHQPSEMDQHSWCSDFHHINCWKWQGSSLVINSVSDTACNFHDNKHVKNVDTLLVIYLKLLRIGYWRCYQSLVTMLYGQFANLQEKYSRWSINH